MWILLCLRMSAYCASVDRIQLVSTHNTTLNEMFDMIKASEVEKAYFNQRVQEFVTREHRALVRRARRAA